MFNDINYFAAIVVWAFPIFTILALITRPDRWEFMPKYQWGLLFAFTMVFAGGTTYSNLKAIDEDLLSRAKEYAGCTVRSRDASDSSQGSRSRVTLDCDGTTHLIPQQYYDDITDAAKRHTAN
ncbi:TPA: hypothetical protein ACIBH9_001600 [Salmonella enterica subsp. diarizonae serovar 61:l,v:z35]